VGGGRGALRGAAARAGGSLSVAGGAAREGLCAGGPGARAGGRAEPALREAGIGIAAAAREAARPETAYVEAIREALLEEMERDERVFLLGEDIGVYGGAFKATEGLLNRFGEERVLDSPIS